MLPLVALVLGLIVLTVGADWLVRGAARLAAALGIAPLIIGLTVVAFGTSAPELAVSVGAALRDEANVALGNVLGSNLFNTFFILGVAALLAPLQIQRALLRFDVPAMIAVSGLVWWLASDGTLARWNGAGLLLLLALYLGVCAGLGKQDHEKHDREKQDRGETQAPRSHWWAAGLLVVGLSLLVAGAQLLVWGAVTLAERMGVSDLVIGLTVVAAGTSLPEAATSIVAAARGEREIAVGNVVGSNLFNLLGVLGMTCTIQPLAIDGAALQLELPLNLFAAGLCLPLFFSGGRISRGEGALLLGFFGAYMVLQGLRVGDSAHLAVAQQGLWAACALATILVALLAMWPGPPRAHNESARARDKAR